MVIEFAPHLRDADDGDESCHEQCGKVHNVIAAGFSSDSGGAAGAHTRSHTELAARAFSVGTSCLACVFISMRRCATIQIAVAFVLRFLRPLLFFATAVVIVVPSVAKPRAAVESRNIYFTCDAVSDLTCVGTDADSVAVP